MTARPVHGSRGSTAALVYTPGLFSGTDIMWFKNLQIYRLAAPFALAPEQLDEKLAARFPIRDDPPFDMHWGRLRRRDGTIAKP